MQETADRQLVRAFQKRRNLRQLGEVLGNHYAFLSRWYRGEKEIGRATVNRWANIIAPEDRSGVKRHREVVRILAQESGADG